MASTTAQYKERGRQLARASIDAAGQTQHHRPETPEELGGIIDGLNSIVEEHKDGDGWIEIGGNGWRVRLSTAHLEE